MRIHWSQVRVLVGPPISQIKVSRRVLFMPLNSYLALERKFLDLGQPKNKSRSATNKAVSCQNLW
ncbi:MAG TPA: hypothetical protein DDZ38_05135 [Gammaproteobacteria bacterium]|nr:hypothetical protein [Gammaproteobacteria bacterium]